MVVELALRWDPNSSNTKLEIMLLEASTVYWGSRGLGCRIWTSPTFPAGAGQMAWQHMCTAALLLSVPRDSCGYYVAYRHPWLMGEWLIAVCNTLICSGLQKAVYKCRPFIIYEPTVLTNHILTTWKMEERELIVSFIVKIHYHVQMLELWIAISMEPEAKLKEGQTKIDQIFHLWNFHNLSFFFWDMLKTYFPPLCYTHHPPCE